VRGRSEQQIAAELFTAASTVHPTGRMARQRLRDIHAVARNARRALARPMGDWGGCPARPCRAPMRTLAAHRLLAGTMRPELDGAINREQTGLLLSAPW
jgi:hypothetical protein